MQIHHEKAEKSKKGPTPCNCNCLFSVLFLWDFFFFVQKKIMVDGGQVAENRPVCLSFFKTVFYSGKRKKTHRKHLI